MKKLMTLILFVLCAVALSAQELPQHWNSLKYFEGNWTGEESGKAGIGKGERVYEFIFTNKYLYCENTSKFEPQEKYPKGEVHQDRKYFSYDSFRKLHVLREFHIEGFVNQYYFDSGTSSDSILVFMSEAIENVPPGFRARITYNLLNGNKFEESFELAPHGKDFSLYLKNIWTKIE